MSPLISLHMHSKNYNIVILTINLVNGKFYKVYKCAYRLVFLCGFLAAMIISASRYGIFQKVKMGESVPFFLPCVFCLI